MNQQNHSTELRKNKHLNDKERYTIELRLKNGVLAYKIAKELNRPINTILNEIKRGTTTQIKQGKQVEMYLADTGAYIYKRNRKNSCRSFKRLECSEFINYVVDKIKKDRCSPDACVGYALASGKFERSKMVCTNPLYNYIDLGLLDVFNADLPIKLRRNTKSYMVKKHKKNLGKSIAERPIYINEREEFGHLEIDTVVGQKSNSDCVLLTILEKKQGMQLFKRLKLRHQKLSQKLLLGYMIYTVNKLAKFLRVYQVIMALNLLNYQS